MLDLVHNIPEDENNKSEENQPNSVNDEQVSEPVNIEKNQVFEEDTILKIENQKPEVKLLENKAVKEIESKIAESAEGTLETEQIATKDYRKFSLEELVDELGELVHKGQIQSINKSVNSIKSAFNIKFGELLKKEKEIFLAEGGDVLNFQYSNPLKSTYNSYLYDYKTKRNEYFANQEKQLNDNLAAKLEIIESLKALIENATDGGVMYKAFKEIQDKWKAIGPIPRAKYSDTWKTYHHHVERFYDLLHISNDLRDLDFKHNLEEKLKLVEKAEALSELKDINQAFKELQVLHKMWKEDIGPVDREHREKVWDRFSEATKKIHDKRHSYFKDLKSKYEENVDLKLAVIDKINALDFSHNTVRRDWQKSIKEVEALRKEFFAIGSVPRAKNDEIWDKFKAATRKFNSAKNNFFKDIKKTQLDNLNKKKLLIEQAASLKESEDWDNTTEVMKKIQADWKKIGHVPRKYSDKIWKDFKDACNYYFDRLHQKQDVGNQEELEAFNKKKKYLIELKTKFEESKKFGLDQINEYSLNWRNLGRVPYEMRHINTKFNKFIGRVVKASDIEPNEMEILKFSNLMESYLEQKNYRKLDTEQLFVRKRIEESTREIQQLENNIGFLSNVSDDNPMVKNVREKINSYKKNAEIWKLKLQYLINMNYDK